MSTTTEVAVRDRQALLDVTDSWVGVLEQVYQLARGVCETEFVPEAMRGRPEAVAAVILTGRELGVGPMTALAHIHLVKGKPGMSAQLMRQQILAAGHSLRYVESTDTRCIAEGRRRGEVDWTRVTFTADQAKRAQITLGQYPEDKLVARATSRLARRIFADCLGGVPYLAEELADGIAEDPVPQDAAPSPTPAPAPRRTAQRRTRPAPVEPEPPALDPAPDPGTEHVASAPADPLASREQMTAMAAAMSAIGYRSRDEQHGLVSRLLRREIGSAKEITAQEAHGLLDDFTQAQASGDPQTFIDDLLGVGPADVVDGEVVAEDPPL